MILYIKSLHIIFVVSWFAGLFYLPRIFVNIALVDEEIPKSDEKKTAISCLESKERLRLILMAKKLFRFTTPLMVLSILLGLWFHVWYARRSTTKLGVVPYLAPRLAVVGAYAAYIIVLDVNNDAWELHHYLIAWIGTLFCAFDHPASVVCLAITTGIFVQGLAAYGPAEISDRRAEYVDWSPNGPT